MEKLSMLKKLFEIQNEIKPITKTKKWAFGKYVPLDEIWSNIHPILKKYNIVIYHFVEDNKIKTVMHDLDNDEWIKSAFDLEATDPQKKGSAISYGKRYNLGCIFNIITDEDNDADDKKADKTLKWDANIKKVKSRANKKGANTQEEAEEILGKKLWRVINLNIYSELEAKEDLLKLLS
jgi:hypothetical protein